SVLCCYIPNKKLATMKSVSASLLLVCSFLPTVVFSQETILSGTVTNSISDEPVPAVSVEIKGTHTGTFSNEKGVFRLSTGRSFPLTLIFTSIGFNSQEFTVSNAGEAANIHIRLVQGSSLGVEVVVSASRVPEKILESPVSI